MAKHPNELRKASPRVFEEIMKEVFLSQGYDVELTAQTRDGGVDLICVRKEWPGYDFRVIIECKRYHENLKVGVEAVRSLSFLIEKFKADRAFLVTTSSFSKDAIMEANHPSLWRVNLKDFDAIQEWFQDYYNHLISTQN